MTQAKLDALVGRKVKQAGTQDLGTIIGWTVDRGDAIVYVENTFGGVYTIHADGMVLEAESLTAQYERCLARIRNDPEYKAECRAARERFFGRDTDGGEA